MRRAFGFHSPKPPSPSSCHLEASSSIDSRGKTKHEPAHTHTGKVGYMFTEQSARLEIENQTP